MLDSALKVLTQPVGEVYYFQLYPLSLSIIGRNSEVPAPGTTYRFTIMKGTPSMMTGQTKFDETRLPIESNFQKLKEQFVMVMPKCPINFYVPNFTNGRNNQFVFNLYQTENKTEYFIAEHTIDIQEYVDDFRNERTVRFEHKASFSDDYEL